MDNNPPYSYKFFATTESAWGAMLAGLKDAQKSIYWEVYIFVDDKIGQQFIDILCAKAVSGVDVKIIIDAIGSYGFSDHAEKKLRDSGAELLKFNRLHASWKLREWFWRLNSRNHRKVLIIDENVAFLGGVNISLQYQKWLDLYIRIEGQVTRSLLRAFAKSYVSAGGEKIKVWRLLHPKRALWREYAQKIRFLIHSSRFQRASRVSQVYIKALARAEETVHLISPYFVPNKRFLRALAAARARGVKVNLYLPLRPDHKAMELLARWYYRLAEKAGATIYFTRGPNHSKGMTVDNNFGMIGSANLSRRSFWLDAEAGVTFTDAQMVAELNAIFNQWRDAAIPSSEVVFSNLGILERIQQWILKKIEAYF